LNQKDISASDCCNDQGACHEDYPATGMTNGSSSGVPLTQLLLCQLDNDDGAPIPYGTIGLFPPNSTCPSGWITYLESAGRFLIPGYSYTGTVESQASPLISGEDRMHQHKFSTTFHTNNVEYVGIAGCCNSGPSADGTYPVNRMTDPSSTGIPYIQLLTCTSQAQTFDSKLPSGTLLFNQIACTSGWNVSIEAPGRFLVSLPQGAVPGASFGGKSLPPAFSAAINNSHDFMGSFDTKYCGVGLASGCCAHDYAGNAEYTFGGHSADASVDLPFLAVPQCLQLADLERLQELKREMAPVHFVNRVLPFPN